MPYSRKAFGVRKAAKSQSRGSILWEQRLARQARGRARRRCGACHSCLPSAAVHTVLCTLRCADKKREEEERLAAQEAALGPTKASGIAPAQPAAQQAAQPGAAAGVAGKRRNRWDSSEPVE